MHRRIRWRTGLDRARRDSDIPGIVETCPQALRRGRLTNWAENDYEAHKIMRLAGHNKLETSQWYVGLADTSVVEECNSLAEEPVQVPA